MEGDRHLQQRLGLRQLQQVLPVEEQRRRDLRPAGQLPQRHLGDGRWDKSGCLRGHRHQRKTVGAGITGRVTGHWVATVSAPAGVANRKPDCSGTNCLKASEFLNAVRGSNHWTYSVPFVWLRGKYTTKNNGSWFDTTVNWPFNDQGDITGTL